MRACATAGSLGPAPRGEVPSRPPGTTLARGRPDTPTRCKRGGRSRLETRTKERGVHAR
jgi:hypothetical protein